MVSPQLVKDTIASKLPDAHVEVQDLTGGGDHYQALVVSSAFEGKSLVKQHQLVYGALQDELDSNAIHALALKTYTPAAWQASQS
ncbi:MAG: BolA family protein [Cyanophyceae cyanobacterium]